MVPYLRAANVKDGQLDLADIKEMNFSPREQEVFAVQPGDVLVSEGAGSLSAVGAAAVWSGDIPGIICFQNTLLRMRPRGHTNPRYLAWWARHAYGSGLFASIASGANIYHLSAERVRSLRVAYLPPARQQAIADYLDRETTRIDALITARQATIERLYERCDAEIKEAIRRSALVDAFGEAVELRRVLAKHRVPAPPGTELVTAYRDGQVTLRSLRRAGGYTEAMENSGYFEVREGDVVLHGLDGFAGAIGTAEASGACSPVYHVMRPLAGADAHYWGRMLRVLAVTGYLALFVTSTRERAYDMRNWGVIGRIPVPKVPLSEQRRVGDQLRRIPGIREIFERSARLVFEHRQALITAAVTGKLDIPDVA
jgi:type I restriction enzyme, S subunit